MVKKMSTYFEFADQEDCTFWRQFLASLGVTAQEISSEEIPPEFHDRVDTEAFHLSTDLNAEQVKRFTDLNGLYGFWQDIYEEDGNPDDGNPEEPVAA